MFGKKYFLCFLVLFFLAGCASVMPGKYERPPECINSDSLILNHLDEDPRGFVIIEQLTVVEAVKRTSVTPDDVVWFLDWCLDSLDAVTYADFYMLIANRVDWFNGQFDAEIFVLRQYFGKASLPTDKLINECDKALIRKNFTEIKALMQIL